MKRLFTILIPLSLLEGLKSLPPTEKRISCLSEALSLTEMRMVSERPLEWGHEWTVDFGGCAFAGWQAIFDYGWE